MFLIQETFRQDALAKLSSSMLNAQKFAENMLEMAREIGDLNLRTGKAGTDAISSAARKMLGASNPAEFLAVAATVARPDFSVMHAYAEQLGGIATRRLAAVPGLTPLNPEPRAAAAAPAEVAQTVETSPESLAAVAAEASIDMPAAVPALAVPADSALTESIALENAAVMSLTPDAKEPAVAPSAPEAASTPAPQPSAGAAKVNEDAVAEAALPADNAAAGAKIANKAAASPAVLKAGVAEARSRDGKKAAKSPVQVKGHSALPQSKTKKPGM